MNVQEIHLESLPLSHNNSDLILLSTDISPVLLARYAIALSNGNGGLIVVGVFAGQWQDASDIHPLQITHAIFELSGGKLSCFVHHREIEGKRVVLAYIPQAPYLLSTPSGEVLGWDGSSLIPLQGMGRTPQAEPDYTDTVSPMASLSDLDPSEVGRLRRSLQGRSSELSNLPDLDFLEALGLLVLQEGQLKPNLAGVLMAGTPQALRSQVPQAEICYYYHKNSDVEFQFREDMLRPLPAALERLRELIQARNSFAPLQVGLFRLEIWDFDEVVYREAILNALIHRDYRPRDVVQIHHYPDRLEIQNPGGLAGGITSDNILRHQPKRRNPLLAEALMRLGYVEQAGVGVDKMYQLLLRHGKEPPEYLSYPDSVCLTIRNPQFDVDFVRLVARKQEEMQTFSLDMLIVLAQLKREGESERERIATALQLPADRILRILTMMEEANLIERFGRGKDSLYALSESSRAALGLRRRATGGANLGALQAALSRATHTLPPIPEEDPSSAYNPSDYGAKPYSKGVIDLPLSPLPAAKRKTQKIPQKIPQAAPALPKVSTPPLTLPTVLLAPRSKAEQQTIILNLAERPQGVCNADVRHALDLNSALASRLLRGMCQLGWLRKEGASPRATRYYWLEGTH